MLTKRLKDLASLALLVTAVVGCKQLQHLTKPTVLKSSDGKFQITVPPGWLENSSLNVRASIGAANTLQETYVIVMTEDKSDFSSHMSLDSFTEITRTSMMSNLKSPDASPPINMPINGNPGRQYMLKGETKGMNIAYLITTVETSSNFHQVITWTLRSRIDRNQSTLQDVTESFREVLPVKR